MNDRIAKEEFNKIKDYLYPIEIWKYLLEVHTYFLFDRIIEFFNQRIIPNAKEVEMEKALRDNRIGDLIKNIPVI